MLFARNLTLRVLAVLVCLLALSAPAIPAEGEETPPPGDAEKTEEGDATEEAGEVEEPEKLKETPMQRGQRKLSELDEATEAIETLIDVSKGATGEKKDLLRIQAMDLVEDVQDLSADLVELIPKLEGDEAEIEAIRNAAGEMFRTHAELYIYGFGTVYRDLTELLRKRLDTPPDELAEYEATIADTRLRLNWILEITVGVATNLDKLGFDDSELWTEIDAFMVEYADDMAARLKLAVADLEKINDRLATAQRIGAQEDLAIENQRAQAAEQRQEGLLKSLDLTADFLETREISTSKYRQLGIQVTGQMTEKVLDKDVIRGLLADIYKSISEWIRKYGPRSVFRLVVMLLFALMFRFTAQLLWFALRLVVRPSKLLGAMISRMVKPVSTLAGLIVGMWFLGANPGTLLAGVGVASLVVGLALQDTLGNIAAGAFILVYRPYDEGDIVQAGGVTGTVKAMGLANTTIVTFDNRRLFVPNRKIWAEVIENRSAETTRRVDTIVRIGYGEDVDRALEAIREIVVEHEMVLDAPAPGIFVSKLDDSWVEIAVRPWTSVENWWPLTTDLPKTLRVGLAKRGIDIPFPRAELDVKSGGRPA